MTAASKESRIDRRGTNPPEKADETGLEPFLVKILQADQERLWDQARFVSGNRSLSSRSTDSDGIGGPKR
jgi:hypothetical protein